MDKIDVACAVIVKDGKILVAKRSSVMEHAGMWEFPGGKINDNETAEQALIREINEELSITIEIKQTLTPTEHAYENVTVKLFPFIVGIKSGLPQAQEHEQIEWYYPDDLPVLPWTDADIAVVMEVVDLLG